MCSQRLDLYPYMFVDNQLPSGNIELRKLKIIQWFNCMADQECVGGSVEYLSLKTNIPVTLQIHKNTLHGLSVD